MAAKVNISNSKARTAVCRTDARTRTKVEGKVNNEGKANDDLPAAIMEVPAITTVAGTVHKPPVMIDANMRDRFLAALRDCGAVGVAAEQIGSNRWAMFRAREHNPDFAAAWDLAMGRVPIPAIDAAKLEAALFKRLLRGVKRNRLFQGEVADVCRVYEDRLAFQFLARLMPDKYGANAAGFAAEPVEVMSREEFMALISAKPRSGDLLIGD